VRNEAEPTRNDLPGGEECWLSYPQPNVSLQQQMTPDMKQFRISMLRIRVAGKECQPSAKQHKRGQECPRRRADALLIENGSQGSFQFLGFEAEGTRLALIGYAAFVVDEV